jgi:hypothetical protein
MSHTHTTLSPPQLKRKAQVHGNSCDSEYWLRMQCYCKGLVWSNDEICQITSNVHWCFEPKQIFCKDLRVHSITIVCEADIFDQCVVVLNNRHANTVPQVPHSHFVIFCSWHQLQPVNVWVKAHKPWKTNKQKLKISLPIANSYNTIEDMFISV